MVPLTRSLSAIGYQATLFKFALIQGAVVLVAALALKKPPKGLARPACESAPAANRKWIARRCKRCCSGLFWIMYAAFVLVAASGLMVTAQLAPIATAFNIDESARDIARVYNSRADFRAFAQ